MANIQLSTGKTIYFPTAKLIDLNDEEYDRFMQNCIADDQGTFVEDPFSNKSCAITLEEDEEMQIEEAPIDESEINEDLE